MASLDLDVLADEVVAEVLDDQVAVATLDALVVDTKDHGGVGLLDAAPAGALSASEALTWHASDGDELLVTNADATGSDGTWIREARDQDLSLIGLELKTAERADGTWVSTAVGAVGSHAEAVPRTPSNLGRGAIGHPSPRRKEGGERARLRRRRRERRRIRTAGKLADWAQQPPSWP